MEELEIEIGQDIYKVRDKKEMYMLTSNDTFMGYILKNDLTYSGRPLESTIQEEIIRRLI